MKRKIKFEKSLQYKNPELAREWHPTKNGDLIPQNVTYGSNRKVWWFGTCSHEWESSIKNRVHGKGCSVCAGKTIVPGINDLTTTHPHLAKEWHPTKNIGVSPETISKGSHASVWWLGLCGHEWEATVYNRVKGKGCPFCSGQRVLKGFNDLSTTHPHLAKEFHPSKNGNHTPYNISKGMGALIWWVCTKGHEWEASPNERTSNETGCPFCSGHRVLENFNDLATLYSLLAQEWDMEKNAPLKPTEVTAGSGKKVWWKGSDCGHSWEAIIVNRTSHDQGCPVCANKKVVIGVNDLATTHPDLAAEWHPTKNGDLTPEMLVAGSNKSVWWQCPHCPYEWETSPNERTQGKGCSVCSGQKVMKGVNDLATTHPEIAKQWHPTKNDDLKPTDVTIGSSKKAWWHCNHGHEWETFIYNRKTYDSKIGTDCPYCQMDDSKGIMKVKSILDCLKIPYHCEQSFEDCRHINLLRFDIVLRNKQKEIAGLIEFDGQQHFEPVEYWGGVEGLKATQLRDRIKTDYCINNNIPLLRIPYWEFERIEEHITIFLTELKLLS